MLTDIAGISVGHYTDTEGLTGCTVVLLPEDNIASGEVRGGAPGTREFDLLEPTRTVKAINAVVLSGGSAFGLAAADGVMRWCEEHHFGHRTAHARVPIVVAAVIYDLGVGIATRRPGPEHGYLACQEATAGAFEYGKVGVGIGATISKWRGPASSLGAGLGTATVRCGDIIVSALIVVNSLGDVVADGELVNAASFVAQAIDYASIRERQSGERSNTTIGIVATNVALDKTQCHLVAQSGHDGIARAIWPAHLSGDGDALVAVSVPTATQPVDAPLDAVRAMAVEAVARAIRSLA